MPLNLHIEIQTYDRSAPGTLQSGTLGVPWFGVDADLPGHIRWWFAGFLNQGNIDAHVHKISPEFGPMGDVPGK